MTCPRRAPGFLLATLRKHADISNCACPMLQPWRTIDPLQFIEHATPLVMYRHTLLTQLLPLLLLGAWEERTSLAAEQRQIEGWTLHVSEELLKMEPELTKQAVDLLTVQLREIVATVPAAAVKELRKVPLYFSPEYPGVPPRAEYHPGEAWLQENHRDPAMVKAVEFTNIRIFERETRRMPNFALHELAHAYHDRVLEDGFENEAVLQAFARARSARSYSEVEQRFGDGRSARGPAYAMTNPMEYFAECTEACFSTNDFFPFTRSELNQHDPEMLALLRRLWQCD